MTYWKAGTTAITYVKVEFSDNARAPLMSLSPDSEREEQRADSGSPTARVSNQFHSPLHSASNPLHQDVSSRQGLGLTPVIPAI
jgi:hypothetical protein